MLRLLSLLLLGFFTEAVSALTSDSQQPIDIVSQRQSVELNSHRIIFSGRVVITQGSIKIQAERVMITQFNHSSGSERVEATGAPVTFYQRLDDQRTIQGSGQSLQYDAQKGILILQQRAQLKLHGHQIQSDRITYDLTEQRVQADSTEQQRVKMTLQPEQLQPAMKHKRP